MKDFGNRYYRIGDASTEVKLAYTGFLLFAFIGYVTLIAIALLRVGPGYGDIVAHYRGSEMEEAFPRAFGQMLEEAHFHAFIEGVILLVLAHLLVATAMSRGAKIAVIGLAFGATVMDLACPWLIRYIASGFAALQMLSWAVMTVTALILIWVPFQEMWFRRQEQDL